jgi:electron transport complex protein RnfB
MTRIDALDQLLPQTQCTKCGYPNCRSYAKAMIEEGVPHNQCPPGKDEGIEKLANFLGRPILALNSEHGSIQPKKVAFIREDECIGCTKCIQACPVDAIIGAPKRMHTVIASECTGCDLCLSPCPVDCIELREVSNEEALNNRQNQYRQRYLNRSERLDRLEKERLAKHAALLQSLKH